MCYIGKAKKMTMCRNIKVLFNFDPPVTDQEIEAAALQYVRKISGYNKPSKINEEAFSLAVNEIITTTEKLLSSLTTKAPSRDREVEIAKARARSAKRFGGN